MIAAPPVQSGSWAHLVAIALAAVIGLAGVELHRRYKIKNPTPPPPDPIPETPRRAQSRGAEVVPEGDVDLEEDEHEREHVSFRRRVKAIVQTGSDRLPEDEVETRIEAADRLDAEVDAGTITPAEAVASLAASHRLSPTIAKRYLQLAHKRAIEAEQELDESDDGDE